MGQNFLTFSWNSTRDSPQTILSQQPFQRPKPHLNLWTSIAVHIGCFYEDFLNRSQSRQILSYLLSSLSFSLYLTYANAVHIYIHSHMHTSVSFQAS